MRVVSVEEAMAQVRSGQRIYLHGGAAAPVRLIEALTERAAALEGIELVHMHSEGPAPYVEPRMAGHIRHNALFIGPNTRQAVAEGRADYTPVFLSDIPALFRADGPLPLDVALVQVTPPDAAGFCSLGVSVDCAPAAIHSAKVVIAQVNARMPRTRGIRIHESEIAMAVTVDAPLLTVTPAAPTSEARAIGRIVSGLIEDGATLQLGIGAIPGAVLAELGRHQHLGIHTEMFTGELIPLVESGVVDGSQKSLDTGIVVSSFVLGDETLYRFIDNNPSIELHPVSYTNDVNVIAAQHRMVAINSALAVDLTGQVAADSIGPRFYSGIGGQVDFIRGAARSTDGVPIIALPATAKGGSVSRISAELQPGSGVVTTRGDVHWIVTEYGAVDLFGLTIRSRARKLIDLAHPQFRAGLEEAAFNLGYLGRSW